MKINDLKSTLIKKRFNAKSVCFRWHNKNNSGGNFGFNLRGINGRDYEISGYYNKDGDLRGLRFGFIFQAGIPMNVNSIEEMFEFMEKFIEIRTKS